MRLVIIWWRRSQQALWAVVDQALTALTNFGVHLLLIRWLLPEEYGAFLAAYSVLLLAMGFHSALIVEPMLVFGAGKYGPHFRPYLSSLLRSHWVLSLVAGGATVAASPIIALFRSDLGQIFTALGVSLPLILLLLLARRAAYVEGRLKLAALASAANFILITAGLVGLRSMGWETGGTAFVLIGLSAAIVAFKLTSLLRAPKAPHAEPTITTPIILKDHWTYGRWVLGTAIASWIPFNYFYLAVPLTGGLEATAVIGGLMLFVRPLTTIMAPLALLLVPALVRSKDGADFRRRVVTAMVGFSIASVSYWVVLAIWHEDLVRVVLGPHYVNFSEVLLLIGAFPLLIGNIGALSSALRARQRPDLEFRAYVASACVALVVGLPLMVISPVVGTAAGALAAGSAALAAMIVSRPFSR